ncbi:uncharacterized protein Z520_01310 [Fonsecaea multimorphosa CBS 102226]|uniref:Clavaminate synthase-like protein n=1 Tax=Fonsecaea multimorphosa CBS 102226 TaxID=1442371 RepID=A0A0D2KHA7_9EURO|nr:uncharacterized protein Z520_01310 [Fonsecaea multimorphosa CBS 102226]KIY02845.1 hypothetical protein Z520_01310 [Fonsecaea multimorphosa CBS 102226]OAL31009.1 hypothetical protein AYO22_01304 [Fonsecaea multimorphosa]
MKYKQAVPVTVSLRDLESNAVPFNTLLNAFGPDSLGILVVTDLPSTFAPLRQKVLSNSSRLAHLPPAHLEKLTKPSAKYLVGWSHGVETLRPGVVDTAKGSYYINCAFYKDPSLQSVKDGENKFPGFEEYTAPNVWPDEVDIPGFKQDAEELIRLIIDTAVLVARACDRFAEHEIGDGYERGYLEKVVRGSETTKARLLHYFPTAARESVNGNVNGDGDATATSNGHAVSVSAAAKEDKEEPEIDDSWCTTHLDHGCLTGLTSAMFLDESNTNTNTSGDEYTELPSSPDPKSGLYILSRTGQIHKVSIPRDALAFQTGEALEMITRGRFKAVPHFVRGVNVADPNANAMTKIARNTLAVFTQPNLDEPVDLETGLTFGEFARGVVKRNTAS